MKESGKNITVGITTTIRTGNPQKGLPLKRIAEHVLSSPYEISVLICGDTLSRTLNREYKKKDRPTNVLAFPLSEHVGEIVLNRDQIKREARDLNQSQKNRLTTLFIHGLLHLKGYEHGSRMEKEEVRIAQLFGL